MILPAIVLGWNSAGSIARMTRSNLVEIMQNDFIRTARAKGLLESGVIVKHALKNAMLPVVNHDGTAGIQHAVRRGTDRECVWRSGYWPSGGECH